MDRIVKKLKNNSGESIAELLISILISVLGITLLAIMIQTSSKMILSSTEKIREYTDSKTSECENSIIKRTNSIGSFQANLVDSDNKAYRFYQGSGQLNVNVYKMALGKFEIIAFGK